MAHHGAEIIRIERPAELEAVSYNAYRYFLYRDYLRRSGPFTRILITDVRDVVFQRQPFSYPWDDGLTIALEDASTSIGTCPYMTNWITGHLGKAAWEALCSCRVSCSGTTVGSHAAMLGYLDMMIEHMIPFISKRKSMAGYDQGVHNYLLWNSLINAEQVDNSGPVLTLAMKPGMPEQSASGLVLNDSGDVAHIVHQYDRKPDLFKVIRDRY